MEYTNIRDYVVPKETSNSDTEFSILINMTIKIILHTYNLESKDKIVKMFKSQSIKISLKIGYK